MKPKARRWFLTWGIGLAVFGVRGVLPWLIVWVMASGLGPWQAFTATLTDDPTVIRAIVNVTNVKNWITDRACPVPRIRSGAGSDTGSGMTK